MTDGTCHIKSYNNLGQLRTVTLFYHEFHTSKCALEARLYAAGICFKHPNLLKQQLVLVDWSVKSIQLCIFKIMRPLDGYLHPTKNTILAKSNPCGDLTQENKIYPLRKPHTWPIPHICGGSKWVQQSWDMCYFCLPPIGI